MSALENVSQEDLKNPASVSGLGTELQMLMTSGLLPAAFLAVVLNLMLPEEN